MPQQFTNILVPLDGSDFAEKALPVAQQLAADYGATLHLISVAEGNPDTLERIIGFTWIGQERRIEEEEAALRRYQAQLIERISAETPALKSAVEDGDTSETILAYANAHSCDLIVMATNGRNGLLQLAMGSIAQEIVQTSTIPVLLIR